MISLVYLYMSNCKTYHRKYITFPVNAFNLILDLKLQEHFEENLIQLMKQFKLEPKGIYGEQKGPFVTHILF